MTGQTPVISKFMHFSFFEPVYYHAYSNNFPSASNEEQGWWVVIAVLAGHKVSQLRIVTRQALIATHKGNIIATFHQMALLGKGKRILSCLQMEAFGADINDRPRSLSGGKQRILMDGYQIPLQFKNGLAYLPCRKPTADELGLLPHVVMTSDVDWDPSLYDNVIEDMDDFHDPTLDFIDHDNPFN